MEWRQNLLGAPLVQADLRWLLPCHLHPTRCLLARPRRFQAHPLRLPCQPQAPPTDSAPVKADSLSIHPSKPPTSQATNPDTPPNTDDPTDKTKGAHNSCVEAQSRVYQTAARSFGPDVERFGFNASVLFPRQRLVAATPIVQRNCNSTNLRCGAGRRMFRFALNHVLRWVGAPLIQ